MNDTDTTPRHPIRVAAQRTGLTPATLRAWERRYDAVEPGRSDAGQRLYSDRDLEKLTVLRSLTESGRAISMVAALSEQEATNLLREDRASAAATTVIRRNADAPTGWVTEAFAATLKLDGIALERVLWSAALTLGAEVFLDKVIAPFLVRVGAGWEAGEIRPAQEHLASAVAETVLERLTEPSRVKGGPILVVATAQGERHGLGARIVSTAAILEGWVVTYLGIDLPASEIARAAEAVGAVAVAISSVNTETVNETDRAIRALRKDLDPSIDLVVGGRASQSLIAESLPPGVHVLDGLSGLRDYCRGKRI
jgi:MerR family transcriptional regulator, light-induced transcriptional regulator